ncbi:GntR family transcriptional regulator [Pseudohalioglobus sediminis]|uniref:GntR family transcriptional regulator n=1 Tax=Pseudohalioglobus sediminis TaxID=2606449 RepID=A0A5B0X4E5_9GAMM|nr:GntR family transcriptional regulator [Pseudohalioglobus sediminis]KAA1194176.1 GntR family transcriptional regulator [Pseudohalioglobus sediminis]
MPPPDSASTPSDNPHKTLSDRVHACLRRDIIEGTWSPNAKLGIEQLCSSYSVGATPVREALQRLSAEGFVVMTGQRGFRVADVSERELRELTELRIVNEGLALRESVEHANDEWEARVVVAFHQLQKVEKQSQPDLELWETRNNAFHVALSSQCESQWLKRVCELLYDQHRRYRMLARVERAGRDIHAEHEAILEAALAKDIPQLLHRHEAHIRNTVLSLEKTLFSR